MATGNIKTKRLKQIAKVQITRDVVALYFIALKYNKSLLSLLALYEIYGRDVFLFFYVMCGNQDTYFVGKSIDDIELSGEKLDIVEEDKLKLIFARSKKIADALRRKSEVGLGASNILMYRKLLKLADDNYLNFYSEIEDLNIEKDDWTYEDEELLLKKYEVNREKVINSYKSSKDIEKARKKKKVVSSRKSRRKLDEF